MLRDLYTEDQLEFFWGLFVFFLFNHMFGNRNNAMLREFESDKKKERKVTGPYTTRSFELKLSLTTNFPPRYLNIRECKTMKMRYTHPKINNPCYLLDQVSCRLNLQISVNLTAAVSMFYIIFYEEWSKCYWNFILRAAKIYWACSPRFFLIIQKLGNRNNATLR